MSMNFENLTLGNTFYLYVLKLVIILYVVAVILHIICRYVKKDIAEALHLNVVFIKSIPKILINVMIIFLVFICNYKKRIFNLTIQDDMLFTTFLVGVLAIIDLISTVVDLWCEIKEIMENKIGKELDELKKRIDKLENDNR